MKVTPSHVYSNVYSDSSNVFNKIVSHDETQLCSVRLSTVFVVRIVVRKAAWSAWSGGMIR